MKGAVPVEVPEEAAIVDASEARYAAEQDGQR